MGSDAVRNQPYPEDLHLPVDRTRPRPGPNQGFPRRQRLQLPSPRRPRHPHQPHQDRSLLRRLLRRPHQHRHFCSRSLLSTSTSTPTSSPALSATPTETGRANNAQSPCATPPSASYRWTPLLRRRLTSWIPSPRPSAHYSPTSSHLPPKADSTALTTKQPSWSNVHPHLNPGTAYRHPHPIPPASTFQC